MKTIILYYSNHHGNTKKLVDAIAAADPENVELLDVTKAGPKDLSGYEWIGVASGIYAGSFGKPLLKYMKENLPAGKNVFIIFTSAMNAERLGSYSNVSTSASIPTLSLLKSITRYFLRLPPP